MLDSWDHIMIPFDFNRSVRIHVRLLLLFFSLTLIYILWHTVWFGNKMEKAHMGPEPGPCIYYNDIVIIA